MKGTLDELKIGDCATICDMHLDKEMTRRMFDIGFIYGTKVVCFLEAPSR